MQQEFYTYLMRNEHELVEASDLERLCSLFFELSNEDRLGIVLTLMDQPLKLTQLAKKLDLTVQECSRQLARLSDIGLVIKDADGSFNPLPYGRHVLRLFPGFQFLSEHVDYFNTQTLSRLPRKFIGRIGELCRCTPVNEIMSTFANIEKIMQEAKDHFWYMADQNLVPAGYYSGGNDALDRGIKIRCIEPVGYSPPVDLLKNIPEEVVASYSEHRKKGSLTDRILPRIDVTLYMSEKEVAILAFPSNEGVFNYLGFTSTDDSFIDWCMDLHQYYWDKGKKRDEFYLAK